MAPDHSPVVLITGCSSGIGRATARRFLDAGWRVWATARDPTDITDLADAGCRTAALDVTDGGQIDAVVERVVARDSRIDCLVNNAGYGQAGAVEEIPVDQLRAQFEVNVFGPVRLAQAVLPHMRGAGSGRIVNVSSLLGRVAYPTRGAYAGSKHALEALSESLRAETAGVGVDVVLIEPGAVRTGFEDRLHETESTLDEVAEYGRLRRLVDRAQRLSERRGMAPERVADEIYRAASVERPERRYVVGWDARLAILADRVVPARVTEWLYRRLA
ncbi:SDR family oxidoreductase (plasmid) [Halolamina sp. CBA1230]|uniref:SDR family oxidoreductase n=1 Tax=Halolamina sp. CBA1230 TaxID=1853690 RepID=UPI0009A19950|nr:SDR family oxidoreductase [Halolamina sp. CBA1230]QKY22014.1 SDR family oxidoreductase [Halolamina sp. CBA1230]